ncbi:hypothetical protein JCM10908_002881 [Rhodotorula pacifica]|uniref:uncharacterized protein n=1 Tax=Rhodotorula pacifica TaxID=1495444 RepID=UPI00316EF9F8
MATALLEHVLANQLAQNDAVAAAAPHVAALIQQQRVIAQAGHEEGLNGPVIHRWQLRLTALLSASNAPEVRTAGFRLFLETFASSTTLLLASGKAALTSAQSVLASPKSDPTLFLAALEVARLILAKSTWHPEWARENVGAQTVQKLASRLVEAASADGSEVTLPCVATIVSLIPLYPTALRPLSPSFHNLAISLLAESATPALSDAGAQLFVSLYLLAPKGKDGLREAWRTGVEALVGSIDQLASHVVSGIFAEDMSYNHTLSPLAMPALPSPNPIFALARLETLVKVVLLALRTPTTEKAGPVSVPLGALVELGVRLASFSTATPVKERTDPYLRTATYALLPRIQIQGCQVLAQLALSTTSQLATHATTILTTLAKTLTTYEVRSPMRPAISTAYALVLQGLGATVDPEEGKKSLARVWRTVLEDIGAVALEPLVVAQSTGEGKNGGGTGTGSGGNSRRAKRQRMYDPSESMAQRRVAVDEVDLEIAQRGLATLERLARCPHAHFLPPALQLATSRMLLYLTLSPSFFLTHPLASTSTSFFPSTSANQALDIARQSPAFRRAVVAALQATLEHGLGGAGFEEKAVEVWRRASNDSDDHVRLAALQGLARFGTVIHPVVPPQQPNSAFARIRHEQKGGFVGDEEDFQETAEHFRLRVEPEREAHEDEEERMQVEERIATAAAVAQEEGERRRKTAASAQAPAAAAFASTTSTFSATSFAAPTASSSSGTAAPGFSTFAAPSFGSSSAVPQPAPAVPVLESTTTTTTQQVDVVAPSSFIETSTSTKSSTEPTATAAPRDRANVEGSDEGDDDDDDEMPAIDLGGSDEE